VADSEPTAPVTALGDSAVALSGRIWIDPSASSPGAVRAAFIEAVKERFDAEGVGMPYPHTELVGSIDLESMETAVTPESADG
jgi:small-conductance mechanosensitive channel